MDAAKHESSEDPATLVPAPEAELADRPLRLAVIGTPRSGNTWIRGLLGVLYGLDERAIDRPDSMDWDRLPPRCIVQIHQYPDPDFDDLLARHGVRVVTPARHPLDVMISALNYAQHTADAPRWTDRSGVERTLRGASPIDRDFLDYAGIAHPGAVLTIGPAWWPRPGVLRVRYEDLVADPGRALAGLASRIDPKVAHPIERVVPSFTIDARRSNPQVWQYHYGPGRPGLWRELLPECQAKGIADRQAAAFEILGYACDPDPGLDELRAERNWYRLQTELLGRHLADERRRLASAREELDRARSEASRERAVRVDPARPAIRESVRGRVRSGLRRLWPNR